MKKDRPSIKLSILVREDREKAVVEVLFEKTTTIGMRKYEIDKVFTEKEFYLN